MPAKLKEDEILKRVGNEEVLELIGNKERNEGVQVLIDHVFAFDENMRHSKVDDVENFKCFVQHHINCMMYFIIYLLSTPFKIQPPINVLK